MRRWAWSWQSGNLVGRRQSDAATRIQVGGPVHGSASLVRSRSYWQRAVMHASLQAYARMRAAKHEVDSIRLSARLRAFMLKVSCRFIHGRQHNCESARS